MTPMWRPLFGDIVRRSSEEQSDRVAEDAQQEAAAAAQQLAQTEAGFETRIAAVHVQLEAADAATSAAQVTHFALPLLIGWNGWPE